MAEKQLSLPLRPADQCGICGQMYGMWVAQHMKARAIARGILQDGGHPYDHPTKELQKDPPAP